MNLQVLTVLVASIVHMTFTKRWMGGVCLLKWVHTSSNLAWIHELLYSSSVYIISWTENVDQVLLRNSTQTHEALCVELRNSFVKCEQKI